MKMKVICNLVSISLLGACGPARGPIGTEKDAASRSTALIGGASSVVTDKAGDTWETVVKMPNGALVEVKLDANTGEFILAEGGNGPYDYDLAPIAKVLSFKQAVAKANEQVAGEVVAWELKKQPDHYQWEVYIRDGANKLWEIKMFGETGEIKVVEEKLEVD